MFLFLSLDFFPQVVTSNPRNNINNMFPLDLFFRAWCIVEEPTTRLVAS